MRMPRKVPPATHGRLVAALGLERERLLERARSARSSGCIDGGERLARRAAGELGGAPTLIRSNMYGELLLRALPAAAAVP